LLVVKTISNSDRIFIWQC